MTSQAKGAIVGGAGERRGEGSVTTWCHSCDLCIPDVDALAARVVALAVSRDALRDAPASFCYDPPLFPPPSCGGAQRVEGRGGAGGGGGGGGNMRVGVASLRDLVVVA